ncbi:MAG: metallopeptidase TldD-related protein [Nanoarchaeota archaeon]|nr:metallopeptidase TldD-related protein [Nanoarchaeota archaeon]
MKPTKLLTEKLNDHMTRNDEFKISQWHFGFAEGQAISLGLENGEIGGTYTPPSTKDVYGGSLYLIWGDDRISEVTINAETLDDLDSAIIEWKKTSYQDHDAPEVTETLPMPKDLKIKDKKIVDMIKKDSSYFFEILNFYKNELGKKEYTKTIQGQVDAGLEYCTLMNSKGLNIEYESTSMSTSASINGIVGDGYAKRKSPRKRDLKRIIQEIDNYMIHTKNIIKVKPEIMPIILMPSVLGQLFGQYILSNLKGSLILNNQSTYSLEDFKNKKQVFNEKINLVIDGLKDYEIPTIPCTGEGVPSTKQYILANGKLITPFLNRKYAKKAGMPPTSTGDINLEVEGKISYKRMIRNIRYGLIVYDVLGMHTQDPKSGKYSLAVDQGLVIENGEIKGKLEKATIDGNFFEDLKNKNTRFADYRKDELAILTEAQVTV